MGELSSRRRRALFVTMCGLAVAAVATLVASFLAGVTLPYKQEPEERFEGGERTPGDVDILVVGCSYAWGHGVESETTRVIGPRRRRHRWTHAGTTSCAAPRSRCAG